MKALLRFISKNAAGDIEHTDKLITAPAITIGRATDQLLHLRDRRARLQHASIEARNGDMHIVSSTMAGVTVNGRSQRDTKLSVGDTIEVGANVLHVIAAPDGVDIALTFELRDDADTKHLEQSWTSPTTGIGGWGKRRLSWMLAVVVLVFTLLLPGLSLVSPDVASTVRTSSLLPDDSWWLAGPVHSAHSSTAAECGNCHSAAFQRVPDAACMACHTVDKHVADASAAVLGEERCANCHLEHNDPPQLVNQHQQLCADCHKDLSTDFGLPKVADFLDAHPEFRVSLLHPAADDDGIEWHTERLELAAAWTAERSNLLFDHEIHLHADGIIAPDGRRVIECGDCHVPEPGGAKMLPISMDEHCSGCHTLSFDPDDPTRVVPHGDPEGVVQALVEYYSARLLGEDPDAVDQRIRRPGAALTREDRDRVAAEAREQALAVAKDMFERRACTNCHDVSRQSGDSDLPWYVLPVRLTSNFFPHANFSHASHDTEVSDCATCHAAATSDSAQDLLLPDITTCRDCHGSAIARRNSATQTPSTCIMCHSFHFGSKGNHP